METGIRGNEMPVSKQKDKPDSSQVRRNVTPIKGGPAPNNITFVF